MKHYRTLFPLSLISMLFIQNVHSKELLLVDNVRFIQRESDKIVVVIYDLRGDSGKKYRAALSIQPGYRQ